MRAKRRAVPVLVLVPALVVGLTMPATGARAAVERGEPPPEAPEPCEVEPVWVTRAFPEGRSERAELRLVDCDGNALPASLEALSILARPFRVPRPTPDAIEAFRRGASEEAAARFVAPDVMRLHPGLLVRLQALAERFPGRRIAIVSGYRPSARATSRHRHGRALDLRIGGTPRRAVADAARELPETGVGYYPNSVFTHVDVREEAAAWCDWSGPGEPPRYGAWPEKGAPGTPEAGEAGEAVLAAVLEQVRAAFAADAPFDEEPDATPVEGIDAMPAPPPAAESPSTVTTSVTGPLDDPLTPVGDEPPTATLSREDLDSLLASIRDTVARSRALDARLDADGAAPPADAAGEPGSTTTPPPVSAGLP